KPNSSGPPTFRNTPQRIPESINRHVQRSGQQSRQKWGALSGSPGLYFFNLESARLEHQPQSELDVAPLVGRLTGVTVNATFLGLDKWLSERGCIEVKRRDVQIVVIEDVVQLATELQREALRDLEVLVEVHVDVPVTGPDIGIAAGVRQTTGGVRAPVVHQSCAVGQSE